MTDQPGRKSPATGMHGGLGAAAVRNARVAAGGQNEGDCAAVVDAIDGTGGSAPCIRCFALSPGGIRTAMQAAICASGIKPISGLQRGRPAGPVAPAEVEAWLVSREADASAGARVSFHERAVKQRMGRVD